MLYVAGEVHGAAENVEDTTIDGATAQRAKLPIQSLRVGTTKVLDTADTDIMKVTCQTGADTRNPS